MQAIPVVQIHPSQLRPQVPQSSCIVTTAKVFIVLSLISHSLVFMGNFVDLRSGFKFILEGMLATLYAFGAYAYYYKIPERAKQFVYLFLISNSLYTCYRYFAVESEVNDIWEQYKHSPQYQDMKNQNNWDNGNKRDGETVISEQELKEAMISMYKFGILVGLIFIALFALLYWKAYQKIQEWETQNQINAQNMQNFNNQVAQFQPQGPSGHYDNPVQGQPVQQPRQQQQQQGQYLEFEDDRQNYSQA